MEVAVGVDIGGSKIAAGLVGLNGLIGDLRIVNTEAATGGPAVLRRAIDLLRSVLNHRGTDVPSAVGIASGGWIEPSSGRVVSATDLLPGWAGTDLRHEFERAGGLPALALNDAHAMALAEARLGAGRGGRVCLAVAVGTGIGGGITIGGELFQGAHGVAGAVGHLPFRRGGPLCSCGRRGCIEAIASGPAIARSFARCLRRRAIATAARLPDVAQALNSPDTELRSCALRATEESGRALGQVIGGIANIIDPDVVILGGGAALALGDTFISAVRSAMCETVLEPIDAAVVPARLGTSAAVVGAGLAALAMEATAA